VHKLFKIFLSFTAIISFHSLSNENERETVHYAFSNYLGNGIYTTTNQNVTLINLPFEYDIQEEGKFRYGLRLPLSLGFFDFSYADIPDLDLPDSVGTFTFTPGIAMAYDHTKRLTFESYIDMGFARNLTTNHNVAVYSAGVSTLYDLNLQTYDAVWVSRLYFARYSGMNYDASDSYAAFQTGVDMGFPVKYEFLGYRYQPRVFAAAFWYFSEVNFLSDTLNENKVFAMSNPEEATRLRNSIEIGITAKLDKKIGWEWAGIETLGIGYRFANNFNAVRLIFSMPI